jgi:hypothetical protein
MLTSWGYDSPIPGNFLLTIELIFYCVSQLQDGFIRPAGRGRHAIARSRLPARLPRDSDYYHCAEDCFKTFFQVYDEQFSRQYGFWRPYIEQAVSVSKMHVAYVTEAVLLIIMLHREESSALKPLHIGSGFS